MLRNILGQRVGLGGNAELGVVNVRVYLRRVQVLVAQDLLQGAHVHAVLQGHGCEGVAQIMKAYPWQSRPFQHPLEHVQDAVR